MNVLLAEVHMKWQALFYSKIKKVSQELSPTVVDIGAYKRHNYILFTYLLLLFQAENKRKTEDSR